MYGTNINYNNKRLVNSYLALNYFKDFALGKNEEIFFNESNVTIYYSGVIKKLLNSSIRSIRSLYSEKIKTSYRAKIHKLKKSKEYINNIIYITISLKKLENNKNKDDYIEIYNNIEKLKKEKFFEEADIEINKILELLGKEEIVFLKNIDYKKFILEENKYFDINLIKRLEKDYTLQFNKL